MTRLIFVAIIILAPRLCYGQNMPKSPSKSHLNNSEKIATYLRKSKESENIQDTAKATLFLKEALFLADSVSFSKEKTIVLLRIADLKYNGGRFSEAYQYYLSASKSAEGQSQIKETAVALKGLAHVQWRIGDNVNANENIHKSILLFSNIKDTVEIIESSDILASIQISLRKLDEAEQIYNNMLVLAKSKGDLVNLGSIYEHKGVVLFYRKNYQGAIELYTQSLQINQNLGLEINEGINLANIAEVMDLQGKSLEALKYYQKAHSLLRKHNFESGLVFVYYGMGRIYTRLGQLNEGVKYYEKSLETIIRVGENREKPVLFTLLAENYALQGNHKAAYKYLRERNSIKDSIENLEKSKQIEEIQARYEMDRKERINAQLISENASKQKDLLYQKRIIQLQTVMVTLLILLIIFLVIFYQRIKKERAKLKLANQTKDKLFNVISHDLRGPVGNLKTITELIIYNTALKNDSEMQHAFDEVKMGGSSAFFLLEDLLAWSQLQKEKIILSPQKLDVLAEVMHTLEIFQYNSHHKDISIINNVLPNTFVYVDKSVLQTILRNLINNAIKFTRQGGKIIIDNEQVSDTEIKISIQDSGIGIAPDKIEQLFNNQKLLSTYGTRNEKGTGIGLSICKEFVERSGGQIGVSSNIDKGSCFYFTMPLVKE